VRNVCIAVVDLSSIV